MKQQRDRHLSDAEFKTLVIRMLTEIIEFGHKMKEEMKAIQSEIKENIQGPNSEGKETSTQIHNLKQKEEIDIHQNRMKKQEFKKNEERLGNLQDNFKLSKIQIIGVSEGEEEEQEIEILFEQIIENFPNLAKEIDFQEVQEAQSIPKKVSARRNTLRHIINKLPKINNKERILKAARRKVRVTYKGVPRNLSADFSKETLQVGRGWKELFEVMKGMDLL